jgi:putative ABC transport system permease protein
VYLSDAAAARLGAGVRVIGLRLDPGADETAVAAAVRAEVDPGTQVLTGEARARLEPEQAARTRWIGAQLLVAMVTLAGFAAVFVVASTAAFSVVARRRDLALLRMVGATPRQVRRMVIVETVAVGGVAGVVGAVLGSAAAPVLGDLLVDARLEPAGFTVAVGLGPLVGSVAAGLVVALLGVLSAARRAARVRPVEALREAVVERRPMTPARWVAGLVFAGGGGALAAGSAASGGDSMMNMALSAAMALMVASALLAPVLLAPMIRVLTWPLARLDTAIGELVREGSVAAVRRTAATAAPVLLTVGFATLITGMVGTMAGAFATEAARETGAELVVVPAGTPGLSDAAVRAVSAGTAASAVETTVLTGGLALRAVGVDGPSLAYLARRLTVESGSLSRPGVAVTAWVARENGWRPGSAVPLTFADGRVEALPVVAVVADATAPAEVVLARDTVRAHDPSALTTRVYASGVTAVSLQRALAGLGAEVLDVAAYARTADAEEDRLVRIFVLVLTGLSCGYTGIAVANTLLMATADRRRDLAVLRMAGATRRQVLATVAGESALVVAVGTALGLAVAATALLGVRAGLTDRVGVPVDLVMDWPAVTAVCAACLVLALAASVVPAAVALRGQPATLAAVGG